LKYRVLFDTNVLIAGSTYAACDDLKLNLKHHFFDRSMGLIGFVKKHLSKRIGIVTATIEEQAYNALERAVKDELKNQLVDRATDFQIFSVIFNICEDRLRNILSILRREPVDPKEVSKNIKKVFDMYEGLTEAAYDLPKPEGLLTFIPRGFKAVAFDIFKTQDEIINSQLTNLLRKPVEISDKIILAEAIYLLNQYK